MQKQATQWVSKHMHLQLVVLALSCSGLAGFTCLAKYQIKKCQALKATTANSATGQRQIQLVECIYILAFFVWIAFSCKAYQDPSFTAQLSQFSAQLVLTGLRKGPVSCTGGG